MQAKSPGCCPGLACLSSSPQRTRRALPRSWEMPSKTLGGVLWVPGALLPGGPPPVPLLARTEDFNNPLARN